MRKTALNLNFPNPQLTIFPEPIKAEPEPYIFKKTPLISYGDLSINEKINLKFNYGFHMNLLREGVRNKKGWRLHTLDYHEKKLIVGIGGKIQSRYAKSWDSVSTTMWIRLGSINKQSSLFAKYGKEITWEMIVADGQKKRKEKENRQKKLRLK